MQKKIPLKLILLLAIIAVSVGAFFYARPAYRTVKKWRAQYLADQAMLFLEEGDLDHAWKKVKAAYTLYPFDVEVSRAMARVYERVNPSRALPFWEASAQLSKGFEDKKAFLESALRNRKWKTVERELASIKQYYEVDDDILLVEAQWLVYKGDWIRVIALAKELVGRVSPTHESILFYGQVSRFFEAEQKFASDLLMRLAEENKAVRLQALGVVLSLPGLSYDDLEKIKKLLNGIDALDVNQKLAIISYKVQFLNESKSRALKEAKSLFNLSDLVDQVKWARWLNQQGWSDETLDEIKLSDALKRQDLFLVYIDAQAIEGNWREVEVILEKRKVPLEDYLIALFKARAYAELGYEERSKVSWKRVYALAGDDTQKLWFVLQYALRLDNKQQAREAFKRLSGNHSTMRIALYEWLMWEKRGFNTQGVYDVLKRIRAVDETEPFILNDWIYIRLLLGEDLKDCLFDARRMVEENPPFLAQRVTLALAYYRNGDYRSAYRVLEPLDIEKYELHDSHKSVYAAILKQLGKGAEASLIMQDINLENLLPEERQLLKL